MNKLALLGDSVFDNGAYVASGPAVIQQVSSRLPVTWNAILLAVDGDTSLDIAKQLTRLPTDVTHLVLSVGGNDALGCIPRLEEATSTVKQGLIALSQMKMEFDTNYKTVLSKLLVFKLPLMVCTIYDQMPGLPPELQTALSLFNDVIQREAVCRGLPVLDLRMVCTEFDDYSVTSPIEPSSKGGEKLAARLVAALLMHDFSKPCCCVYK